MTDLSRTPPHAHAATVSRGAELLHAQQRTRALIADGLAALTRGEHVIVTGDRHSGFLGALVAAVDGLTPQAIAFMVTHGRGPLYAPIDAQRLEAVGLEVIRPATASRQRPALHVPVDVRAGTTTGLSAADRVATIRALADPSSRAEDFRVPGHVLPIGARAEGVLDRPGHTEAAVDLARLAGLSPATATASMLTEAGEIMTLPEIEAFAVAHGLVVLQIADVAAYRRDREDVIERIGEALLPIPEGRFIALGYRDRFELGEHLAMVMGDLQEPGPVMVRVHTECLAGDVFDFHGCGCRRLLRSSIDEIAEHGRGVLLYIRAPGADRARLRHMEPVISAPLEDADQRAATTAVNGVAISMLRDLGVTAERLAVEPSAESAA